MSSCSRLSLVQGKGVKNRNYNTESQIPEDASQLNFTDGWEQKEFCHDLEKSMVPFSIPSFTQLVHLFANCEIERYSSVNQKLQVANRSIIIESYQSSVSDSHIHHILMNP